MAWSEFPGCGTEARNLMRAWWFCQGEGTELGLRIDQGGWSSGDRSPDGNEMRGWRMGEGEREFRDLQMPPPHPIPGVVVVVGVLSLLLIANVCEGTSLGRGKSYPRGLGGTIPGTQTGGRMVRRVFGSTQGSVQRGVCRRGGAKLSVD